MEQEADSCADSIPILVYMQEMAMRRLDTHNLRTCRRKFFAYTDFSGDGGMNRNTRARVRRRGRACGRAGVGARVQARAR